MDRPVGLIHKWDRRFDRESLSNAKEFADFD